MKFRYLKEFNLVSTYNVELVQSAIRETSSALVDSKLFPLIERAELGDYGAMAELFEMFAYGDNGVKRNFEMALRYSLRLNKLNEATDDPIIISEGKVAYALLHYNHFRDEAHDLLIHAYRYMVANLEPDIWQVELVELISEYVSNLNSDVLE